MTNFLGTAEKRLLCEYVYQIQAKKLLRSLIYFHLFFLLYCAFNKVFLSRRVRTQQLL